MPHSNDTPTSNTIFDGPKMIAIVRAREEEKEKRKTSTDKLQTGWILARFINDCLGISVSIPPSLTKPPIPAFPFLTTSPLPVSPFIATSSCPIFPFIPTSPSPPVPTFLFLFAIRKATTKAIRNRIRFVPAFVEAVSLK